MRGFNNLTLAEAERLALLLEELGEAQQAIGKILRHGYDSQHPAGGPNNRSTLERELGDVKAAVSMMIEKQDLDGGYIDTCAKSKRERVKPYLHHQRTKA